MRAPLLLLTAAAIVATACGSSSDSTSTVTTPTPTPAVSKIVSFKATMNGASEVPANATTGSGVFTAS
jgi:ABC-type glycerol-3-phosphate transport system substrate-binding protein